MRVTAFAIAAAMAATVALAPGADAALPATGFDAADAGAVVVRSQTEAREVARAYLAAQNSRYRGIDGIIPIDDGWLMTVVSAEGTPKGTVVVRRNYRRVSTR